MSSPIFYGRLDFGRLLRYVARIDSDASRAAFLLSFAESLSDNTIGVNEFADEILRESMECRDANALRKKAFRDKKAQKDVEMSHNVPRTSADVPPCPAERQTVSVSVTVPVNTNTEIQEEKKKESTIPKKKPTVSERERFKAPSLDECISFFVSKGSTKDIATTFWGFYDSNGWKVGKNPMVSVKGAMTGWIARNASYPTQTGGNRQRENPQDAKQRRNMEICAEMDRREKMKLMNPQQPTNPIEIIPYDEIR